MGTTISALVKGYLDRPILFLWMIPMAMITNTIMRLITAFPSLT